MNNFCSGEAVISTQSHTSFSRRAYQNTLRRGGARAQLLHQLRNSASVEAVCGKVWSPRVWLNPVNTLIRDPARGYNKDMGSLRQVTTLVACNLFLWNTPHAKSFVPCMNWVTRRVLYPLPGDMAPPRILSTETSPQTLKTFTLS